MLNRSVTSFLQKPKEAPSKNSEPTTTFQTSDKPPRRHSGTEKRDSVTTNTNIATTHERDLPGARPASVSGTRGSTSGRGSVSGSVSGRGSVSDRASVSGRGSLSGRGSVSSARGSVGNIEPLKDSSSNKGSVRSTKSLSSPTDKKDFELSEVSLYIPIPIRCTVNK